MVRQRRNARVARATTVFIGLVIVYAVLAIVANVTFSDNALVQTLLLSLGSAVLGSGIAFFLIRLEQPHQRCSVLSTFIALALVVVVLVLVSLLLFMSTAFVYTLLLTTGAAIFAGSLTFFLVKLA